jgi:hypothetical protein
VVAALLDGVDVVVAAPPGPVAASVSSRLAARARQRGSVLVPYAQWSGADVVLESPGGSWYGLGQGRGRLLRREMVISARGRGAAARPRELTVWLPDRTGALAALGPATPGPDTLGPDALGPDALGPDGPGLDASGPDASGSGARAGRGGPRILGVAS